MNAQNVDQSTAEKENLIDLNEQLLQAEEAGNRNSIEPWLAQDFTIIRACGAKSDRHAYMDGVQNNVYLGRSADESD